MAPDVGRRYLVLGLLVLLGVGAGYLEQGWWRAGPSALSAVVTDVIGGSGNHQPARLEVSIAISNDGGSQVRVIGSAESGSGTYVVGVSPGGLIVRPGLTGQLTADVLLNCDLPGPLDLPPLRLELPDGARPQLHVAGAGALLEACGRASPAHRPLTALAKRSTDGTLVLQLKSPTGRRAEVVAIRAGGVGLVAAPLPITIDGLRAGSVRLRAPDSCPMQWQVSGIPSSLSVDLAPAPDPGSTIMLDLPIGTELNSWFLSTSCGASR